MKTKANKTINAMKKYMVMSDVTITCLKGSVVYITDRQYELVRRALKPMPLEEVKEKKKRKKKDAVE